MKKSILFSLILICISSACFAGEYSLLMNKNDCLCKHMLRLYNADMEIYGQVQYEDHKEFNWIKWEDTKIAIVPPEYPTGPPIIDHAKIAIFDINDDSKDDVIVYRVSSLNNSPIDVYDIFNYGDKSSLDKIIDGTVYYKTRLKSFCSCEGVPVKISDLNDDDIKKLPEKLKYIVEVRIKADKDKEYSYAGFLGAGNKINFLKFKNRFFITFEERTNAETLDLALDRFYREGGDPKTSRRGTSWLEEGFTRPANYTLISEYQKDNTLKHQCLYIREDRSAFKGAPNFDCKKVESEVEKMICNDDDLAWSDKILNEEYQKALKRTDSKKQIIKSQRQWLKHVRNACQNTECLKKAYETRIKELDSL